MSSRKTNEGVMTFFRGDGGEEGKIGLRKDLTKGFLGLIIYPLQIDDSFLHAKSVLSRMKND